MQHLGVALLRLDEVHQGVGQGAVVADAAREHVGHAVRDQVVHDAAAQLAPLDRVAQPAQPADRVDRPHVVLVPLVDGDPGVEVHPEGRAEEGVLDVVHGEGVPRQQPVDPAAPDEPAQVPPAAAVHHHRPRHHDDAPAFRLDLAHHGHDPRHADLDPPLGRDVAGHEREPEAVALLELGQDADAVEPADDPLPRPDVPQLAARGAAVAHHHHRVHPLVLHVDPSAAAADLRPVVGGRVEVVGDEAVAGRGEPRLAVPPGMAAQGDELLDQLAQPLAGVRGDPQLELRELLVGAADREPEDVEAGAALDDLVEDRGEQPRVDEMALGLDDLAERPRGAGADVGNHRLRPQECTGCAVRDAMNASNSRSDRPMRVDSVGRSAMTWAVL